MTSLSIASPLNSLPSIFTARPEARKRMRDFFSSHIRNPNTRRAYLEALRPFSSFCTEISIADLAAQRPMASLIFGVRLPNSSDYKSAISIDRFDHGGGLIFAAQVLRLETIHLLDLHQLVSISGMLRRP